ncbi:MAG: DUF547 domain-containing protein [Chitinophagales bacterium]|nr:DUF547 domain-containing protein [Chitinophagales bacterium]
MRVLLLFLSLSLLYSCKPETEYANLIQSHITESVSHNEWDKLTKKNVKSSGEVDYLSFIEDSIRFKSYLDLLSVNPPSEGWSNNEKLVYWINAYNAFTVQIVLKHYPIESITDIKTFHIPLVNTVWHDEFIPIGDQKISLNHIEHGILRKEFNDPRIHFAINCASLSCPKLRNEAYRSEQIDKQLDDQAHAFFNDTGKNEFSVDRVEVSRIFQWFRKDFTTESTLIAYLNRYSPVEIREDATISYKKYDWSLNEARK